MKTALVSIVILISALNANAQNIQSKFSIDDFKSCWRIQDMIYQENGGKYSDEDVQHLVGELVCFNDRKIDVLNDTIIKPKYSIKKESTKAFVVRNFQVFENIDRWFQITADSLDVIRLVSGLSVTNYASAKIKQFKAYPYEFAYDGIFLYIPVDGSLFRLKNDQPVKITGSGVSMKEFKLTGKEKVINIFYEFYTDADELYLYDQNGSELYHSGLKSTQHKEKATVNLDNATKLTVKIKCGSPNSRWAYWFKFN